MSRDPVGAASYLQSPNELNPWLYAAGSPTRFTDPSGRAIPPTLYSPLSPADPTPVAACKAGNVSACLMAGMTDAEIEAFFAERGVVTRLASQAVEEVTTEVVIHAPNVGILTSIGRAIGIGVGTGVVTGVAFTAAQVTSLRRGCAHGDIASCEILDRYGLGRGSDQPLSLDLSPLNVSTGNAETERERLRREENERREEERRTEEKRRKDQECQDHYQEALNMCWELAKERMPPPAQEEEWPDPNRQKRRGNPDYESCKCWRIVEFLECTDRPVAARRQWEECASQRIPGAPGTPKPEAPEP